MFYDIVFAISLAFILKYFHTKFIIQGERKQKRAPPIQNVNIQYLLLLQTEVNSRNGK